MLFKDTLNDYMKKYNCTIKMLSEKSGLSITTINSFRNEARIPSAESKSLKLLANGLYEIAKEKDKSITKESILSSLLECLGDTKEDREKFRVNLNALISTLSISVSSLSKAISYDASYISKVRSGTRHPKVISDFGNKIVKYVSQKYNDDNSKKAIANLIKCNISEIKDNSNYYKMLLSWIINNANVNEDSATEFLQKIDGFNLNEYIKAINFDEFKVPTIPFQLPKSKTYVGVKGAKQAELDWLKATVLSTSKEPVLMYSDMPIEEMSKDLDFGKKWMYGIALMLKKGLHINQIHNIDRSFNEMMIGLESWIPLYMTGQVFPYYFKNINNSVFMNFIRVSGKSALSGEAINGHFNSCRYTFVKENNDVNYYKEKGKFILSKAYPLMDIYKKENSKSFLDFLDSQTNMEGNRYSILSSLPIYTISKGLLEKILKRNKIPASDIEILLDYHKKQTDNFYSTLLHSKTIDQIPDLSKEDFDKRSMSLSIFNIFYNTDIKYNYEEYKEHLNETLKISEQQKNYNIEKNNKPVFCNIQINCFINNWTIITKNNAPTIHFVVKHPKLRKAIENLNISIIE